MTEIVYKTGDAALPEAGERPVLVAHVVNNVGAFGKGFAKRIAEVYPLAKTLYHTWHKSRDVSGFGLGANFYIPIPNTDPPIAVVHLCAQRGLPSRTNRSPLNRDALAQCLIRLDALAREKGAEVVMPKIGAGYGGAPWHETAELIERTLSCPVTVYTLPR